MNVVKKKLDELRRPDRNVRLHTDKQLHEFRRSLEMFGQIRPIVIDEDGVILAGNGLYDTLLSMGRTEADCYVVTGLTEAGKKKLMLADNRVYALGVDDLATFDAFILELKDDLDIPGFDDDLLQSLVADVDDVTDTLREYGTIDPHDAETIRKAQERHEAASRNAPTQEQPAAPAPIQYATPYTDEPDQSGGTSDAPKRPSILCPKCGELLWL